MALLARERIDVDLRIPWHTVAEPIDGYDRHPTMRFGLLDLMDERDEPAGGAPHDVAPGRPFPGSHPTEPWSCGSRTGRAFGRTVASFESDAAR